MSKSKAQTFNDGIVNIYSVGNIAPSGEKSKEGLVGKTGPLRFERRTVGMNRFWAARQAAERIDRLIRVPQKEEVTTQDIAVLHDGKQYQIKQVQYPPDVQPPSMDLSLEKLRIDYDIEVKDDG